MMKLLGLTAAAAAAALAGSALAANRNTHVMNVALPDGSVARVEYIGDVPPRVTVAPARQLGDYWMSGLPSLANFDGLFEQMDRQMRQIEQMARQPIASPGLNVASYGNLPAGADSVSVVSMSNGGSICTRTTEIVSQGAGKAPKVTTKVSGNCGDAAQPSPQATPGKPIDHT
jgi:hypothetical protein